MLARLREDRLLRWSTYAAVPALWLAIALVNPLPLLVSPLATLALWIAMRYRVIGRCDPIDESDLF